MEHRLELAAKALAIERVATGALAAIAPARAIGAIATPGSDTEAARYVARLLGIRQLVLGVMLWQSRTDRVWLRRMATLNALTEVLDVAATLVAVVQRRGGARPSAAIVGAEARGSTLLRISQLSLASTAAATPVRETSPQTEWEGFTNAPSRFLETCDTHAQQSPVARPVCSREWSASTRRPTDFNIGV